MKTATSGMASPLPGDPCGPALLALVVWVAAGGLTHGRSEAGREVVSCV